MQTKKIPDTSALVKKLDYHAKINTERESKIPSISGLATNSALTAAESEIPDISSLVKKPDYNAKISDIEKKYTDRNHDIYITTSEFNNLSAKNFAARLAQANLVAKADFDTKLKSLNKNIYSNKTKHLLVESEFKSLQAFDSSYLRGKNNFEEDGIQNYSVFQPMYKYFKKIGNTDHFSEWRSKGLSDEVIKPPATSEDSLAPTLNYVGNKIRVKFDGSCLKQDKITYTHGTIVIVYIVYELSSNLDCFDPILF